MSSSAALLWRPAPTPRRPTPSHRPNFGRHHAEADDVRRLLFPRPYILLYMYKHKHIGHKYHIGTYDLHQYSSHGPAPRTVHIQYGGTVPLDGVAGGSSDASHPGASGSYCRAAHASTTIMRGVYILSARFLDLVFLLPRARLSGEPRERQLRAGRPAWLLNPELLPAMRGCGGRACVCHVGARNGQARPFSPA